MKGLSSFHVSVAGSYFESDKPGHGGLSPFRGSLRYREPHCFGLSREDLPRFPVGSRKPTPPNSNRVCLRVSVISRCGTPKYRGSKRNAVARRGRLSRDVKEI